MTRDLFSTDSTGQAVVREAQPWRGADPVQVAHAEERAEQRSEHDRVVSSGLEAAVLDYCRQLGPGCVFDRASALGSYCISRGFLFLDDSLRKMLNNLDRAGLISCTQRRGRVELHAVSHVEAKP